MSVIETINDSNHFYHWLQQSASYKNNFSYEGANAVQEYFERLSDDMGENIEFDPIAWCVEFSEYDSLDDFNKEYWGTENDLNHFTLETLQDNINVIELDNGHVIVGEF